MALSSERAVHPISIIVDYAPVKGKRSPCYLQSCGEVIERGDLRVKETFEQAVDGGEPIHRYHIACYPFALDVSKIEGYDKLNEEDKQKVISRMLPHRLSLMQNKRLILLDLILLQTMMKSILYIRNKLASNIQEGYTSMNDIKMTLIRNANEEEETKEKVEEKEKEEENEEEEEAEQEEEEKGDEEAKEEGAEGEDDEEAFVIKKTPAKYRNGSKVVAKVLSTVARNIWFPAKVISSRPTALGVPEYHVLFLEDNAEGMKEWIPERFIAPPVNENEPPTVFAEGTTALGWRRKPGATNGWWYTIKILRYLKDVPGVFVHWSDFPFPDSILEANKVHLINPPAAPPKPAEQKGVKRSTEADAEESASKKEKLT